MRKYAFLFAVLAVVLALGTPSLLKTTQAQAAQKGLIRFVQASPGLVAVDVYLNDAKDPAFKALDFGKSSAFVDADAGTLKVTVKATGDSSGASLFGGTIPVQANATVEIALLGRKTQTGNQGLRLGSYPVDASTTKGDARVYFVNASVDAPAVDVRNGDTVLARSLTYGRGSTAILLKPGTYTLQVTPAGKTGPALVSLGNTELQADMVYTVLLAGLTGNFSPVVLSALAFQPIPAPVGTTGFVRLTHGSADAPAFDVYVDGARTPAVKGLEFGKSSDFLELPAGDHALDLRTAKSSPGSKPVLSGKVTLSAGLSVEAVAVGSAKSDPALSLAVFPVQRSATAGKARIYFIQAAPKAAAVDVIIDGKVVAPALEFGKYTATPTEVDPGKHNVIARTAGQTTPPVLGLAQTDMAADTVYTVVAIPDVPDSTLVAQNTPLLLNSPAISEAAEGKTGLIRLSYASVSADKIDVYLDGASVPTVKALEFGAATDFMKVPAKDYDVAIRAAGTSPLNPPDFETKLTVTPGETAEVVAMGLLNGDPKFALNAFPVSQGSVFGKARIYVLNASTKAGTVDLRSNGKVVLPGVKYGDFSTKPLEIDPGTYNFAAVPAGKAAPVLVDLTQTDVAGNNIYFVVALDDPTGSLPAQNKPMVLNTALPGTLRITHAVANGPDVDVYLGDAKTPAVSKLTFGAGSDLMDLAPKDYTLTLREAGAKPDAKPLYTTTVSVKAGVTAEVVVTGLKQNGAFLLSSLVAPIDRGQTNGKARLYVVQAAPRGGSVDLRVNGQVAVKGVAFGTISAPVDIAAGSVNLAVTPGGKAGPVLAYLTPTELAADTVYTLVVLDDAGGTVTVQNAPLELTSSEVK